jgi:serine phosphatase RsbU (regulator of sigma subunit)
VFVPLLLAISIVSVAAASVVVFWLRPRGAAFWLFAQANVPFAVVVTFAVGVMSYLATDMRLRFERRNRELQQAVTTGNHALRQQEEEVAKAREVQEALLPRRVHHADGIEIVGSWQPARIVGGDYFDVLAFTDSKIGICIGDVVGKGISAALLMANLQAAVRAFASDLTAPSIGLVLYTDGVTEATNATDADFGEPRLMAAAVQYVDLGAAALQTRLMREVEAFCDGKFHDDATLVIAAID